MVVAFNNNDLIMKRLSWLYILLILVGCTDAKFDDDNSLIPSEEFYATMERTDSRTYVDGQIRMRWHADDRITIFKEETYNREYKFTGKTGANAGGFAQVSVDDEFYYAPKVDANYAVYPHSTDTELDETDCFFTLTMPAEQTYAENSFGLNANTMVAISETGNLMFKNVGAFLRVRLYGENTSVSSVTLATKGTEAIAGEAKVTPVMDGNPTCQMTGTGKSIRLSCETPVTISSDADSPTDFWIVVPPVTLTNGFSVTVENENGVTQVYDVDKSFTFERNKYYDMVREVEIEDIKTVHVATAGTLSTLISEDEKYSITSIKITGKLNGTDIKFIRENMAGCTTEKLGSLKVLDLSDATIVEGGDAYYTSGSYSYTTENNILGENMFASSSTLENVVLPRNITTIEHTAFLYCSNLSNVIIYGNVKTIGKNAFHACSLSEIVIPEGVETIEQSAFYGAFNGKKVTIPQSVTSIGDMAFYGNTGIEVHIQDLQKFIKACTSSISGALNFSYFRLFLNGVEMNDLVIPEGITEVPPFVGCSSLTSVILPEGAYCKYGGTFQDCTNLTEAKFPNSYQIIAPGTFSGSGLTTMTIGNNVTKIWYGAFYNCPLEKFYSYTQTPPVIDWIPEDMDTSDMPSDMKFSFGGVNKDNATLYVPVGCKSAYEASDWAEYFCKIIEMEE